MASSAFNKFNIFTENLLNGVHNLGSDTLKWVLTNTAPVATNATYSDISGAEVANGNGYTTGGITAGSVTVSTASGVAKATLGSATLNATGAVGPFRYAVLVDTTPTSPSKPLMGYYDYGSSVTLSSGEAFAITPDATNGLLTAT